MGVLLAHTQTQPQTSLHLRTDLLTCSVSVVVVFLCCFFLQFALTVICVYHQESILHNIVPCPHSSDAQRLWDADQTVASRSARASVSAREGVAI